MSIRSWALRQASHTRLKGKCTLNEPQNDESMSCAQNERVYNMNMHLTSVWGTDSLKAISDRRLHIDTGFERL